MTTTSSESIVSVRMQPTAKSFLFFQKFTSPPPHPSLNIGQRAPDRGITFKFFSYFDWIWSGEIVLGRQSSVRARAARWTLISTCSCVDRRPTTAVTSPIEPKKFPKMRSRVTYKWPMTIHESRNDREMFFSPATRKFKYLVKKSRNGWLPEIFKYDMRWQIAENIFKMLNNQREWMFRIERLTDTTAGRCVKRKKGIVLQREFNFNSTARNVRNNRTSRRDRWLTRQRLELVIDLDVASWSSQTKRAALKGPWWYIIFLNWWSAIWKR